MFCAFWQSDYWNRYLVFAWCNSEFLNKNWEFVLLQKLALSNGRTSFRKRLFIRDSNKKVYSLKIFKEKAF